MSCRFGAIAKECGASTDQGITIQCNDIGKMYETSIDAFHSVPAYAGEGYLILCARFSITPPLPEVCHTSDGDGATVMIHEMSHEEEVYDPHTVDIAYGYEAIQELSSRQALRNADTFSLYANG